MESIGDTEAAMKLFLEQFLGQKRQAAHITLPAAPSAGPVPGKWDKHFREWIEQARLRGTDPNDVGDEAWANDYLSTALPRFYLPYVVAEARVLELGPGSGRVTRHLAGRCRRLELVDNSEFVLQWMRTYLAGRCEFETHLIDRPRVPKIEDASIDFVLAHGVIEHLDFDETAFFLDEFHRVLRRGGHVSFNYNSLHGEEGAQWFAKHRREPGHRCIFRFYTPDYMRRLGQLSGFHVAQEHVGPQRLAHIVFVKP